MLISIHQPFGTSLQLRLLGSGISFIEHKEHLLLALVGDKDGELFSGRKVLLLVEEV